MTRRDLRSKAALLLAVVLVPGCAVGPNYRRPKVNIPPAFRGAEGAAQRASFADLPWWEVFKDEALKGLIKTALANNYDLAIAVTRVEQARQVAAQARSQYFPSVDYKTRLSEGKNQLLSSPASGQGGLTTLVMAVATVSWEADVWGRIRRLNEAAKAQYLATDEARRGVMLTLVSDLSEAYFRLLGLRLQLEISVQSENTFDQTRILFAQRANGGVSSMVPVARAAADQAVAAGKVVELQREIALTEDQIRVLLGQNPGAIETKAKLLDEPIPPQVPAGLPSALLERRPDVLSAEQNIRYANARIGVAQADYFPKIGLTGFFGKLSAPLENITAGSSTIGSIGGIMEGPIFEGGRLRARKREAVAAWEQAKLQYQQTALNAFRDVSDALISREKYEGIRADQVKAVESYQEAVRLVNMRYDQGFSSYYEVLEAQQQLFPAELSLAQTQLEQRLVIVQLYKALGGGWKLTDEQFKNASIR
ncbi:MAG TPA: efflux transporter outer membrane subunit [Bryobacteraceae bacterium]|nr:efflux transporter outer membrane subunit [Bryobacteraceae bacterium]